MSANDRVAADRPMPRLASVAPSGDLRVRAEWAEGARAGRVETIDLTPLIGVYKFYAPLRRNPGLFNTIRLVDRGTAVEWGDGAIDMPATSIERLAEEAMNAEEFRCFLDRNGLTQHAAAFILGRSRRQIAYYLKHGDIPRVVALACIGYECRHQRTASLETPNTHVQTAWQSPAPWVIAVQATHIEYEA